MLELSALESLDCNVVTFGNSGANTVNEIVCLAARRPVASEDLTKILVSPRV